MNSFKLRAKAVTGEFVNFTLYDLPIKVSDSTFVLLSSPGTPILKYDLILRGDNDSNLYEGDIISYDDTLWVICYERGFYAISVDYTTMSLPDKDIKVVGNYFDTDFPVRINTKKKHLFKHKDIVFRLQDIVGGYDNKLIVRSISDPISPDDVQQEVCARYDKKRIYLGDIVNGVTVSTVNGRLNFEV